MKVLNGSALLFICFIALSAAKEPDWQIAKVLDSKSSRTYLETGASTTATTDGTVSTDTGLGSRVDATTTASTRVHHTAVDDTELMIAGKDYSYVIHDPVQKAVGIPTHGIVTRSIANRGHGCRFVVGDDVKYYQDKAKLHIIDADGKECKLDILRQERIQR